MGQVREPPGRSYATFKADTNRLYVQWKPADEGELLRPANFEDRFRDLERQLAIVGVESIEPVTERNKSTAASRG